MNAHREPPGPGRWLAIAAVLVALATVVAAIVVMGPPSAQREAKLDRKRVHDLERIVRLVEQYVERRDALPPDLATLADQPGLRLAIADPRSAQPYEYEITGDRAFRLCAVFATDTAVRPDGAEPWNLRDWHHGAGRHCFDRKVAKKKP